MRVLVPGGNGFIGAALCVALDRRGHDVTALARSPDDAELPPGVATVEGDVTDPATLEKPVTNTDAVINLVSLSPLFKPPRGLSHDLVHRQGTEHLLAACEAASVDRFVQMSGLGADPASKNAYLRAKGHAEDSTMASDLDWTVLRPSVVFGDDAEILAFARWISFPPMTTNLTWPYLTALPGGGRSKFQPIWREDLVELMADILEDDAHVGQAYELGGPEVYTLAEIVRMVHRAANKPARLTSIPLPLARTALRLGEHVPGFPLGADQAMSLDFDNIPASNDIDAFDHDIDDLRTLPAYLGLD